MPLSCKQLPLNKLPAAAPSELYPYILQHGRGILSLSTLQQGLQHFIVPGIGYITYTMMRNGPDVLNILSPLALGEPICDPVNFMLMAEAFLQQHPEAIFMQVSLKQPCTCGYPCRTIQQVLKANQQPNCRTHAPLGSLCMVESRSVEHVLPCMCHSHSQHGEGQQCMP
jgi:hypothetical protein